MTPVNTFRLDIVRFPLPLFGHNYPLDKAYTLYMTQIFQISGMFSTRHIKLKLLLFQNSVLFHNIYVA